MEDISKKLLLLVEKCVKEPVDSLDKSIRDYKINSIDFMKLVVSIEEQFDFEFEDHDLNLEKYNCFSDLLQVILNARN